MTASLNNEKLTLVDKNSPAWDAGLTAGDELIALNGLRMSAKDWESHIEKAKAGDRIIIMGARDDTLSEFAADILPKITEKFNDTSISFLPDFFSAFPRSIVLK